jgi:hypothetical protein
MLDFMSEKSIKTCLYAGIGNPEICPAKLFVPGSNNGSGNQESLYASAPSGLSLFLRLAAE